MYTTTSKQQEGSTYKDSYPNCFIATNSTAKLWRGTMNRGEILRACSVIFAVHFPLWTLICENTLLLSCLHKEEKGLSKDGQWKGFCWEEKVRWYFLSNMLNAHSRQLNTSCYLRTNDMSWEAVKTFSFFWMITSSGEQNDKEVLEASFVRLMQMYMLVIEVLQKSKYHYPHLPWHTSVFSLRVYNCSVVGQGKCGIGNWRGGSLAKDDCS